jgi:glyoxylase-like metal-dependent hydrolase (beta-lactamase superfamily II)
MQRERISENVYWFQSEVYAQVTAGVIVGPQWAVVVDTLAMPEESKQIRQFVTETIGVPIRYLINTHSHADHAWGNCYFPNATIIAHTLCAKNLKESGIEALEATKKQNPAYQNTEIVLPHLTFAHGEMTLKIGKKNLIILLTPGHSADGISVFVEEDRVLFAGDAFMAIPQLNESHYQQSIDVIRKIGDMGLENIVQGHGDIILRGEIEEAVQENITYIENIHEIARKATRRRNPADYLNDFESSGKSRVYLGGLAEQLHKRNLIWMFKQVVAAEGLPKSDDEYEDEPEEDDFEDMLQSVDQMDVESLNANSNDDFYPDEDDFEEDSD